MPKHRIITFMCFFLVSCGSDKSPSSEQDDTNQSPIVENIYQDQVFYVGTPFEYDVTLNGSAFIDPDGDSLSYTAEILPQTSEINFADGKLGGLVTNEQIFSITITATDQSNRSVSGTFELSVLVNESPIVVNKNQDQIAFVGVEFEYDVTKNGTVFSDPDGDNLNYSIQLSPESSEININDGVLKGTFSSEQSITVTISASDKNNVVVTDLFLLTAELANSCHSFNAPSSPQNLALTPAFGSNTFREPVGFNFLGTKKLVALRDGNIVAIDTENKSSIFANLESELGVISIQNLNGSQQAGLTSIAIAPAEIGNYLFIAVNGQDSADSQVTSRVVRYEYNQDGLISDSRTVVLEVKQTTPWHHIGKILFTEESYLLVGLGDGNARTDSPDEYGFGSQDLTDLRGSILRIDVSSLPYSIPADNPFVGTDKKQEIYAYGLRNPWQFTIDSLTQEIWAGDVGDLRWEEINIVRKGENYGWPYYEGDQPIRCPDAGCSTEGLTFPVYSYDRNFGVAIIGGHIYRGSAIPELYGAYIFSDFISATIYALTSGEEGSYQVNAIAGEDLNLGYSSFTEGPDSELYAVQRNVNIFKLVPKDENIDIVDNQIPQKLSATGCVNMHAPFESMNNIVAYEVNTPLWSDGADKSRFISVPEGQKVSGSSEYEYAIGTTLIKTFSYEGRPHETRLMVLHDSGWGGYTYEWDWNNKEATLLYDSKETVLAGDYKWTYPSRNNCFQCHTDVSGRVLGFEPLQLNKLKQTGEPQLEWLRGMNVLQENESIDLDLSLANITDTGRSYTDRFKSYVHANCAFCHQPNGNAQSLIDFRYTTAIADMNICNTPVEHPLVTQPQASKIIDPENYLSSALYWRINTVDSEKMPPVGRELIDENFRQLLVDWHITEADICKN